MTGSIRQAGVGPGGIDDQLPISSGVEPPAVEERAPQAQAVRTGNAPLPGENAILPGLLSQSLSTWRTDATAASRVTAEALPLAELVPEERRLHADLEKVLYEARGDVALGTMMSRKHFEAHVARNRPKVEAQAAHAERLALAYERKAGLEQDPQRREGLELRAGYYQALAVSARSRFEEIVQQNGGICDLRYGPVETPIPERKLDALKAPRGDNDVETWWNKAATDGMNELRKLDLKKIGRKELKTQIKGMFPGAGEVSEAHRAKYSQAVGLLSEQLATAVIDLPATQAVNNQLKDWIGSATRFLHAQVTFSKTAEKVKKEAGERGGLYPGEDRAVDKALAPAAKEVEKAQAELKKQTEKLKTSFHGGLSDPKIDWDPDALFLTKVGGKVGVQWEKADFRARVFTDISIDKPLTKDAVLKVHGRAEVKKGSFSAGVYGRAKVEKLWSDPVLGPTFEVGFDLAYGEKTKGTLKGKAIIPMRGMRPGEADDPADKTQLKLDATLKRGPLSFSAGVTADLPESKPGVLGLSAGVGYTRDNLSLSLTGGATLPGNRPGLPSQEPTWRAKVGLTYRF